MVESLKKMTKAKKKHIFLNGDYQIEQLSLDKPNLLMLPMSKSRGFFKFPRHHLVV